MRKILISQNAPANTAAYDTLARKYGVEFEFKPFFLIEPLTGAEFRTQRIELSRYTAVVFSSRHAIDAYFKLCEESRFKVPETIKYFCTTELVANYLQKHIVYRKRKIFYGDGSSESVAALIAPKHVNERFLICTSDPVNVAGMAAMLEAKGCDCKVGVLVKGVNQDLTALKLSDYELVVLYNAMDVTSLQDNFPDFKQGSTKFLTYGKGIVKSMADAGLEIELQAPTAEIPSVVKALEYYLSKR